MGRLPAALRLLPSTALLGSGSGGGALDIGSVCRSLSLLSALKNHAPGRARALSVRIASKVYG